MNGGDIIIGEVIKINNQFHNQIFGYARDNKVRRAEEEARSAKAVQLGPQVNWTKWNLPERRITWQELWRYEPLQLSFLLRLVNDMLPTPTNLKQWKLSEDPSCSLCENIGSLQHILSSCPTALAQGRYTWRHDQVLRELANILENERRKERPLKQTGPHLISFVRQGEKKPTTTTCSGILQESQNWDMLVDLGKKLKFPEEVAHTTLRPDIVLWSRSPKLVVLVELTVHWEERCEEAYELKKGKYQDLVDTCRERGWKTWIFPVEVGCRGFPSLCLELWASRDKSERPLSTLLGELQRGRPVGSGYDAVNRLGSQHRRGSD